MMSDFLTANAEADSIEVEIRSNGGSTSEARIIFDQLKGSGKSIKTIGYKVHSSAVILFLAGSERLISNNADMLIHPVWVDAFNLPWQLTAEDLQDFANEIKAEEDKLKEIYASVIGTDKMEEVGQLMADSTTLTASDAVRLGFATGTLTTTENKSTGRRALAYTNKFAQLLQNKKTNDMSAITDLLKNLTDKVDKLVNSDTPEAKNASEALSEGGAVYFEGDALADGVAVFIDEAMEEAAPDGDHLLADGRTITVSGGVVSAIASAGAEGAENKEDDELRNEVAEIKASVATLVETVNKMAGVQATMNTKVTEFQNKAFGDKGNAVPEKKTAPTPQTVAERVAAVSK
jgi:ATP-dependent protease ClpP protease subunit